jgi:hypothetical protein
MTLGLAFAKGMFERGNALRFLGLGLGLSLAATLALSSGCSSSSPSGESGSGASDGGGESGGDSGPPFTTMPIPGPDVDPPADITLSPDVVIVHGGASVLKTVSTDHGVWTLDKSAKGVSELAAGKILLIAGLDAARVTALKDSGDTVDVTVAPVSITDVIQAGSFDWKNQTIDPSQGVVIQGPEAFELSDDPLDAGPGDTDSGSAGKLGSGLHGLGVSGETGDISFSVGNWKVSWNAKRSGNGVDIKVQATVNGASSSSAGGITSLGSISGTVNVMTHLDNVSGSSGSLSVASSTLNGASLSVPMSGTVNANFTATTPHGSQYPGQALVKLPLSIEYPIPCWAAIPCYLSFQTNLLFQPSLATVNSGFQLSIEIPISGSSGFTFSGGSASATSKPTVTPPTASPLDSLVTTPSAGAIAMVASLEAPRVGFGIGTLAFVGGIKAGIFVDAINSFGIVVAPDTSLVPCREVDWKFSASGGGEVGIKLFDKVAVSLEQSATLYTYPATGTHNWYTPSVSSCKP